jgi:myo-inositol-1(or 4)-monophosphatase
VSEPTDLQPLALADLAASVARRAATLVRSERTQVRRLEPKSTPTDALTQTDLDAERLIRDALSAATPGCGFVAEEGGVSSPRARLTWILDPLDGTVNFTYGLPVVAISIAAAVDGHIVAGAVVDVVGGETFAATRGAGATLDGRRISTSSCASLDLALVTTGFSYRSSLRAEQGSVIAVLLPLVRDIRCFGSAALQLCWVAAGRSDAHFERDTKLWDHAAGVLIAAEAGAIVESPCPENGQLVIAATPGIHESLRRQLTPMLVGRR